VLSNHLKTCYMDRNQKIQEYLSKLSATSETNYSLWKTTKRLKRPQTHHAPIKKQDESWVRRKEEKAKTFAEHLSKVFKPNPREITQEEKNNTNSYSLIIPFTQDIPASPFTVNEVKAVINYLNLKKALGYDLITNVK